MLSVRFPHGQLSGSTHPKVWSKAPACNSNSTSLLVLHMHRTCLTAREGGKQAAHKTHEARRQRLIPCNFVMLEKKWDYLRFPLRSSIGMVDIRQTCSAHADSFHSFVRVGWIQFLFLRQLSLAHLSHRTCHNSEVAQYISFFSCPVQRILYNSSCLQLLKYIIPLAGKQRELSMRQLVSILVLLDTDTKTQLLRAKVLRPHFQVRASQQSSLCMFKAVVPTLKCGFDYVSGSSGCHLLK